MEFDIEKMCRVCLKTNVESILLFEHPKQDGGVSIAEMISDLTIYQIRRHDDFPHLICYECIERVENAYSFKKDFETAQRKIITYLDSINKYQPTPDANAKPSVDKSTQTIDSTLYPCEKCDLKFIKYERLREHRASVHKGSANLCRICHKTFNRLAGLKSHIMAAHPEIGYHNSSNQCYVCNKMFTRRDHVTRHIRNVHKIQSSGVGIGTNTSNDSTFGGDLFNPIFEEGECNEDDGIMGFKAEPKPYIECLVCYQHFSSKNRLTRHMQIVHQLDASKILKQEKTNDVSGFEAGMEMIVEPDASTMGFTNEDGEMSNEYDNEDEEHDDDDEEEEEDEDDDDDNHDDAEDSDEEEDTTMNSTEFVSASCFVKCEEQNPETEASKDEDANKLPTIKPEKSEINITENLYISHKDDDVEGRQNPAFDCFYTIKDGTFECNMCKKNFKSAYHVRRHFLSHTQEKAFPCTICDMRFNRADHLKKHMRKHNSGKPFKCDSCSACYTRFDNLKRHEETHMKERNLAKPFQCDICSASYGRADNLKRHKKMCHPTAPNTCPTEREVCEYCNKSYSSKACLQKHVLKHIEKFWKCKLCSAQFESSEELKEHAMLFEHDACSTGFTNENGKISNEYDIEDEDHDHDGDKEEEEDEDNDNDADDVQDTDEEEYTIMNSTEFDPASYFVKSEQQIHEWEASKDEDANKLPTIKQEKADFSITENLYVPTKSKDVEEKTNSNFDCFHRTKDMKFGCNLCEKTFKSSYHVRRHFLSHTQEKAFPCTMCGKTFKTAYHVRRHLLSHTKKKAYPCTICDMRFNRVDHLKSHMTKHNPVKPFQCDSCSASYGRSDHLKRHKEMHHSTDPNTTPTNELKEHVMPVEPDACTTGFTNEDGEMLNEYDNEDEDHDDDGGDDEEEDEDQDDDDDNHGDDTDDVQDSDEEEDTTMNSTEWSCLIKCEEQIQESEISKDEDANKLSTIKQEKSEINITENLYIPPKAEKVEERKNSDLDCFHRIKDGKFGCNLCEKTFKSSYHVRRHFLSHTQEKAFPCTICDMRFSRADHLKNHMTKHNPVKPFQCDSCSASYGRSDHLKRHKEMHHSTDPNTSPTKGEVCEHCNKSYSSKAYLQKHMLKHTEKCWKCKLCSVQFESSEELKEHAKTHNKDKPFLCSECGLCFPRKNYLIIHMRRHNGERPYKCQYCDKGFPRSTDLKAHEKCHTGEKTHFCNVCGKGFPRPYKLSVHMRIHTGEKPYSCMYCPKAFAQCNDLKAHIRRHTGERFRCEICGAGFIQKYNLTQHKADAHGIFSESRLGRVAKVPTAESTTMALPDVANNDSDDKVQLGLTTNLVFRGVALH